MRDGAVDTILVAVGSWEGTGQASILNIVIICLCNEG